MIIKRLRIPLMLLAVVMVMCMITPTVALAEAVDLPVGFSGMDSVDLEVDSGLAWHPMSDEEAEAYGLEAYKGTNVYLAGNSVPGKPESSSVSNLGITVSKPGILTFEYALSTYYDASDPGSNATKNCYMAYNVNSPVTNSTVEKWNAIAQGVVRPEENGWAKCSISIGADAFVDGNPATVYIAFHRNTRDGNENVHFAAIRNTKLKGGNRDDVVQG